MKFFIITFLYFSNCLAAKFDFFQSSAKAKSPIVVFVHGGAWISGAKEQYKFVGEMLAKNGICAAIAGYSLAPKVKHPVQVDELNKIILEVGKLKNSKCDSRRIFLVGHSAGAHMIAFWNTKYSSDSVKGFVGVEGIYDLVKLAKVWPDYKDWFLTAEFGDSSKWEAASPAMLSAKSKTKWLLTHSKADELVDLAQTENFQSKLKAQGVPAEILILDKPNHFGSIESAIQSKELRNFLN